MPLDDTDYKMLADAFEELKSELEQIKEVLKIHNDTFQAINEGLKRLVILAEDQAWA